MDKVTDRSLKFRMSSKYKRPERELLLVLKKNNRFSNKNRGKTWQETIAGFTSIEMKAIKH